MVEIEHDSLKILFFHLPVYDTDSCIRQQLLQLTRRSLDGYNFVVKKINLSAALQLALAALDYGVIIPL